MKLEKITQKILFAGIKVPHIELRGNESIVIEGQAAYKKYIFFMNGFLIFTNQRIIFFRYHFLMMGLNFIGKKLFGRFLNSKKILDVTWEEVGSVNQGAFGLLRKNRKIFDVRLHSGRCESFMIWNFKEWKEKVKNSSLSKVYFNPD